MSDEPSCATRRRERRALAVPKGPPWERKSAHPRDCGAAYPEVVICIRTLGALHPATTEADADAVASCPRPQVALSDGGVAVGQQGG
jgi:hypothetical protein